VHRWQSCLHCQIHALNRGETGEAVATLIYTPFMQPFILDVNQTVQVSSQRKSRFEVRFPYVLS